MADNSLTIPFSAKSGESLESSISTWAALEQVGIPKSAGVAVLADVFAMVGYAKNGKSARDYIQETCSSVGVSGNTININIGFYVWVSDLDLPYILSVNNTSGSIGTGTRFERPASFDVIFNNNDAVDLGRLFDGTLRIEMPAFADDGSVISPSPTVKIIGTNAVLSERATTVFRANGTVEGYKHTLTISLKVPKVELRDPATGNLKTISAYSTANLKATVRVAWGDCDPTMPDYEDCIERTQDNLEISFPACVSALLNACVGDLDGDGDIDIDDMLIGALGLPTSLSRMIKDAEGDGKQIVWWSICTGKVIKQKWKPNHE